MDASDRHATDPEPLDTEAFDTEVRRVVDRLRSMPLSRLPGAEQPARQACLALLDVSRSLGDPAPSALPVLRPTAAGDQLAVLAADVRAAALRRADPSALATATSILIGLRQAL